MGPSICTLLFTFIFHFSFIFFAFLMVVCIASSWRLLLKLRPRSLRATAPLPFSGMLRKTFYSPQRMSITGGSSFGIRPSSLAFLPTQIPNSPKDLSSRSSMVVSWALSKSLIGNPHSTFTLILHISLLSSLSYAIDHMPSTFNESSFPRKRCPCPICHV